ncbi:DUF6364 family protein [uncultured Flavobacterium sp.]|uniref:DUF6364 family protein n=1 Tax=uncultured Flavobacterium sp. TaxID=165435 RepID=UPI0034557D48
MSKLTERYLRSLAKQPAEKEIGSIVESLTGVMGPINHNYKKGYTDYLSEKYS